MRRLAILLGIPCWIMVSAQNLGAQDPPRPPKPPRPPRPAEARAIQFHRQPVSYLGIGVVDIDAERAKALNLKEERGAEIKSVAEDSPAAKAGLQEGDVVLEYNQQRVEGMEQLVRLVRETPPGRQVTLTVWRQGATHKITATVGSRTEKWWGESPEGALSFSIPVPPLTFTLPDLPRHSLAWRTPALGLESESLSSQLAEFFGVKEGVLVRSVTSGSPADKAGIKAGDVIIKVGDTRVSTPREISSALRSRSDSSVPMVIVRNRKEMTVTVNVEGGFRQTRPVRGRARLIQTQIPSRDC